MTKYKQEQEKIQSNTTSRIDALSSEVRHLNTAYADLTETYDQLLKSHNDMKKNYYLQRAKELGYDKRIEFIPGNYHYPTFTIDDHPTEYYIIHDEEQNIHTLYADGIQVRLSKTEANFLSNIVKALLANSSEPITSSISELFAKQEKSEK